MIQNYLAFSIENVINACHISSAWVTTVTSNISDGLFFLSENKCVPSANKYLTCRFYVEQEQNRISEIINIEVKEEKKTDRNNRKQLFSSFLLFIKSESIDGREILQENMKAEEKWRRK